MIELLQAIADAGAVAWNGYLAFVATHAREILDWLVAIVFLSAAVIVVATRDRSFRDKRR
jgi:hypothetical protein